MPASLDHDALRRKLLAELSHRPLALASELTDRLGISQPTFSRLCTAIPGSLLTVGRTRNRRYSARRSIEDLGDRIPLYQIDADGKARRVAMLHPVLPERAFYVEGLSDEFRSGLHDDLPYFLHDLRPSGFLGRAVPVLHPELHAPSDVRNWSGTQVVRYLGRFGWNLSGNLIVGDEAYELYVRRAGDAPDAVDTGRRARTYPERAQSALSTTPGSSAGGEQPKFLATLVPGLKQVIVKFSAPTGDRLGRRQADLLVSEHVAHEVLREHEIEAARSSILLADARMFLEVERFDRTPRGGRSGLLSLLSLDLQYVGSARTWTESAARLASLGVIERNALRNIAWLELFGRLIGNSDMHGANLSFFARGERVLGLAPVYDMHPASYAGQSGNIGDAALDLPSPRLSEALVWDGASQAALQFWKHVAVHRMISKGFRSIAIKNRERVLAYRKAAERLPVETNGPPDDT